ncbi:branched-chain amino acid ABC transporter permease [Nocardioides sp. zg-536]|uniref:Branched-chain amino acid ABC transporter permease n=1 Tax=Nocardioides faecalis TaxID=2803858 RepID=A0A938Y7B3_9ACTN|nr:branched-chain amino acid ABC transporter permease [Nocardioides faecalis]MBM9460529.1 branched-chain amino acid ABC transporter permease [Nocardioides faecalis]MBS4754408.1 branched-chain amino acid ABC transporter permease [Nocardioides faecalis]QVI57538.1 branched-chain amino acid ABC transporter permease [Nocardioides faecalis]
MKNKLTALPTPVKIVLWVLVALLAYALPLLEVPILSTPDSDFASVLFTVSIYCLVALGLNIVVGYAGLLDLGYVGFYAVGAYTVAILTSFHANWPMLLALPVAVAVAMISGVILGAPTLRVRGDYLAIVTLGFGEIIRIVAVNLEWLGGNKGINNISRPPNIGDPETDGLFQIPHLFWGDGTVLVDTDNTTEFLIFGYADAVPYYWMGLTAVILVLLADILIKNSRVGRSWEATREDEDAAELMGVPTFRFKLLAFATGAFVGGLAGALFASRQSFINPQSFLLLFSILYLAAVVVGGQGNRWGVLVGAFLVAYLPERFRGFEDFRVLVFGLALVLLATLRPEGLLPPKRTVRAKQVEAELEELEEGADPGHDGRDGEGAARV